MSRYDWMADALCAQADPSLWHATGGNYTRAKRICAGCPVQPQCADHTARIDADAPGRYGMWAGQTKKQRETARANAERQAQHEAIARLLDRGGMTVEEIADHIGCSDRTVHRVQAARRQQTEEAA